MLEIRIHGRGGQGNVVAAYLLAHAGIAGGLHAQAFPFFGAERRGAPVAAYVRLAARPIRLRAAVRAPHYVILQDEKLLGLEETTAGLVPGGGLLVNSPADQAALHARLAERMQGRNWQVMAIPASDLSRQHLGRDIPNTALLAGWVALCGTLEPGALEQAMKARLKPAVVQANLDVAQAASSMVAAGAWHGLAHDALHDKPNQRKETDHAGAA
jgi:pyruvate ferredoxin oxidoreductase gamma subunit